VEGREERPGTKEKLNLKSIKMFMKEQMTVVK
jgi:hypothetical protein